MDTTERHRKGQLRLFENRELVERILEQRRRQKLRSGRWQNNSRRRPRI